MDFKDFLKPTPPKIILFIVLMLGLNYLIISLFDILDTRVLAGVPLGFYPKGSFYLNSESQAPPNIEFSWMNFSFDILFWYIISCMLVFWYQAQKKLNTMGLVFAFLIIIAGFFWSFISLVSGAWGMIFNPLLAFIILALIVFILCFLLYKSKFFGIKN